MIKMYLLLHFANTHFFLHFDDFQQGNLSWDRMRILSWPGTGFIIAFGVLKHWDSPETWKIESTKWMAFMSASPTLSSSIPKWRQVRRLLWPGHQFLQDEVRDWGFHCKHHSLGRSSCSCCCCLTKWILGDL